MYAAIAGLRTHMQNLNVIGNNVANVNTAGYKSARAVFRTSIYTTLNGGSNGTSTTGGVNPSQIGYGANVGTVDIDMSTGSYSVTGKPTDCMINGDGFFLVGSKTIALNFKGDAEDADRLTSLDLTRTGDFDFMADGYLAKDSGGSVVYGFLVIGTVTQEMLTGADAERYKGMKVGDPIYSDQLVPIRQPRVWKDAEGGMHVGYPRVNGGIQKADPATGILIDDPNTEYDETGKKDTAHLLDYGCYLDDLGNVVDAGQYELATLTNITIDQITGVITATCGDLDGQQITIGCLAVGKVTNPNGVTQVGNSMYKASEGSGDLRITAAGGLGADVGIYYVNGSLYGGENATGKNMLQNDPNAIDALRLRSNDCEILSSGLEMSKTDLAQEIANMIVTQRGYQANTRIVTVTDSMLEELVNMKR